MEIVIRASIIFFFLLLLTRGMKKRTLGRHGAVRDAAARHARRHRAAGRHPGGLLAHGRDPRREHVRVLDHRAVVRHLALAPGRPDGRRRAGGGGAGRRSRSTR